MGINIRNPSGAVDPTPKQALDGDEKRVKAVIKEIKEMLAAEGFELLARIEIRDKLTGRCYR